MRILSKLPHLSKIGRSLFYYMAIQVTKIFHRTLKSDQVRFNNKLRNDYSMDWKKKQLSTAYLGYGEFNIISVDYHPLAPEPCYLHAVHNLPVVARCTAQLLDYILSTLPFTLDDVHVIGFSLGAQTAGMIANYMKAGRLRRITGSDESQWAEYNFQ